MRLERLSYDKIKIFLTFEDLQERGISKEEIWMDVPKVHDLFRDMISEASTELGFEADGPVVVEVFSLPSQGMVVIVTKSDDDDVEESFDDSFMELQVSVDFNEDLIFSFESIEDVLQLAGSFNRLDITSGELYYYKGQYYLKFNENDEGFLDFEDFISIILEYGNSSTVAPMLLKEYGKVIIDREAIKQLNDYFL
ncbi:genetic competence negative regulator [Bacillus shivajii]|uniref:genetic competence negative regulator n=1 Tax=Bacillus shivajii TaxID=1983719 RepID=UPI001CFBA865|nr:genetic competence negative regulator [Bacillus shivajii]UCZ54743.1 genetic competence negative regulator [Bacillus shivajii]